MRDGEQQRLFELTQRVEGRRHRQRLRSSVDSITTALKDLDSRVADLVGAPRLPGRAEMPYAQQPREAPMAYRIKGHSTEFCSCHATCPRAFGLPPDRGGCEGVFAFHIESGQANGVDLSNTYAVLAASFGPGPWTDGGFTAALILDSNGKREQI